MIPFKQIYKNEDRSWSLRLVQHLAPVPGEDDLLDLCTVLKRLADPQTAPPLLELLARTELPVRVRDIASRILSSFEIDEPQDRRRSWWHSGDAVMMTHAVRVGSYAEADLIEQIASNPQDERYCAAIERMERGFSETRFQHLVVKALSHKIAKVRQAAAAALYQCQPIFAEDALIDHLYDGDYDVEKEVIHTLVLCRSSRGLQALHRKKLDCSSELQRYADSIFHSVRSSFKSYLAWLTRDNLTAAKNFQEWLKPIQEIIDADDSSDRELSPDDEAEITRYIHREPSIVMSLREFENTFGDPNGEWKEKKDWFWRIEWDAFSGNERAWLAKEFLTVHPDPYIRARGCDPLTRWNEWENVLTLLDDPSDHVRWSAALRSGRLPANEQIKTKLHSIISDIGSTDRLTHVAIESFLRHEPAKLANSFLLDLAQSDPREAVRNHAIRGLTTNSATKEIDSLRNLLHEPPDLTWSCHSALIAGCTELGIPLKNELNQLNHADDVYLQCVLAIAKDGNP